MSEPSRLQQTIAAQLNAARVPTQAPPAAPDAAAVVRLSADERRSVPRPPGSKARPAMALVSISASAAILAVGFSAGFYLLPVVLALAGAIGAILICRPRAEPLDPTQRRNEEQRHDRDWIRNETSSLLSAIHDALGDIALVRTPDGRIVHANAVFRRLTGGGDPTGRRCEALGLVFRPEEGAPNRFEVEIATPSGSRTFTWHDILARDPATGALMLHSIGRDVTEERQATQQREAARRRAELSSEAKSRLLATVSHEIRTPLAGILGMSHLIGQTRLTAEQKNYLAGMRQSGHALVQLVDDLLDFASIEAGHFALRPAPEPIRQLIESVVEMLAHGAHEKGIEIGSFIDAAVPGLIEVDAARLRQVLFNVIGNAVKFTQAGGVSIATALDGADLVISVSDTGPGMTADEQARVFDEFEQAGGLLQRRGGSGLGLSISRRIMEQAGGTLTVSSAPGQGSRFNIRLGAPRTQDEPQAEPRRDQLKGARVLLLAPDGPAARALCQTISTLGGMCRHAASLEAALLVLSAAQAGIGQELTDIIVDHRHAALFRRLRLRVPVLGRADLRRIYLVNPEERADRPAGRDEGYDAWLIRPLREKSLVEVLRGRMTGLEPRDALAENQPILRDIPEEPRAATRVILAEDDPVNAMMVRAVLERAGHTVETVGDFRALDGVLLAAGQTSPAAGLLVTDLHMPGGDGRAMLARIRAHERDRNLPAVPVIVLTAGLTEALREDLLQAGADAVLGKPAEPDRLLAEVERLLA